MVKLEALALGVLLAARPGPVIDAEGFEVERLVGTDPLRSMAARLRDRLQTRLQ